MDYVKDTKDAYKNVSKAQQYQEQYTKGFKWARFTMWRQRRILKKIITEYNYNENDKIIDIPCGTGFIGKILCESKAQITASDISEEMIKRAENEYAGDNFKGFIKCDITNTPFEDHSFDCAIVLAFLHRLPKEIRKSTWEEIIRISKNHIIVNYSFDSTAQKIKKWILNKLQSNYIPAPSSLPIKEIKKEIESYNLKIKKMTYVVYFFSGKIIFQLEKKNNKIR
tara:strand:- start:448 stop:1122 length:675 start_codon:yes stop_codon:yes gene_type:complete